MKINKKLQLIKLIKEVQKKLSSKSLKQLKFIKDNVGDIEHDIAFSLGYSKEDYGLKYLDMNDATEIEDTYNRVKEIIDKQDEDYQKDYIKHGRAE